METTRVRIIESSRSGVEVAGSGQEPTWTEVETCNVRSIEAPRTGVQAARREKGLQGQSNSSNMYVQKSVAVSMDTVYFHMYLKLQLFIL